MIDRPATDWNLENIAIAVALLGLWLIFSLLRRFK